MRTCGRYFFVVCIGILSAVCSDVSAQSLGVLESAGGRANAFYRFADSGDLTMRVKVWGDVQAPGLYEVSEGTLLSTLLSVAGGPHIAVRTRREDVELRIRVFRPEGGELTTLFDASMTDDVGTLAEEHVLHNGDLLLVERYVTQRTSFRRDVLPIITSVATLALVALQIINLANR